MQPRIRLLAAGIDEDRAHQQLAEGVVLVDREPITDSTPTPSYACGRPRRVRRLPNFGEWVIEKDGGPVPSSVLVPGRASRRRGGDDTSSDAP